MPAQRMVVRVTTGCCGSGTDDAGKREAPATRLSLTLQRGPELQVAQLNWTPAYSASAALGGAEPRLRVRERVLGCAVPHSFVSASNTSGVS